MYLQPHIYTHISMYLQPHIYTHISMYLQPHIYTHLHTKYLSTEHGIENKPRLIFHCSLAPRPAAAVMGMGPGELAAKLLRISSKLTDNISASNYYHQPIKIAKFILNTWTHLGFSVDKCLPGWRGCDAHTDCSQ